MSDQTHHAGCVIVGTAGLLIRGASGSGKSALADTLLSSARARGNFAALVSDDRTLLEPRGGGLVASVPSNLSGMIEIRGLDICLEGAEEAARVHLVVDLQPLDTLERLPEGPLSDITLEGVSVPRLIVPETDICAAMRLLRRGLSALFPKAPGYI